MHLSYFRAAMVLCLLILGAQAHSAQVQKLYQASVPVASQSVQDRDDALAQALERVLIKVSGDREVLASSGALKLISQPEQYVVSFSYRDNPDYLAFQESLEQEAADEQNSGEEEASLDVPPNESQPIQEEPLETQVIPAPYLLEASFAERPIAAELIGYGVPIWGQTRPSLLVWLVDEFEGERRLHGASSEVYIEALSEEAKSRGLPIFFPVMDLSDMALVDANELWGLFTDAVDEASQRYRPDLNLLVRLGEAEGELGRLYYLDWVFDLKGISYAGDVQSDQIDVLWASLFESVARVLASRYAVKQSQEVFSEGFTVEVDQVDSFEDYAQLKQYLKSLPNIERSALLWVKGTKVAYQVELKGQTQQFFEYIELGGKLTRIQALVQNPPDRQGEDLKEDALFSEGLTPVSETAYFLWR